MKPKVKVFTRDKPCTKLHLWNCFKGVRGWKRVQVDMAHSIIGVNAPRYMLREDYVKKHVRKQDEYYALTTEGQNWLSEKFKAYLRNHPRDRKRAKNLPNGF